MSLLAFEVFVYVCCLLQDVVVSAPQQWDGKVQTVKTAGTNNDRHKHDYEYEETTNCKDQLSWWRCEQAERDYKICQQPRGKILCPKTCHVCHLKPPSREVPCERTALGCCWDGVTTIQGPRHKGCPECKDDDVYAGLCSRWKMYCTVRRKIYHAIVNRHCHRTCGKCPDSVKKPKVVRKIQKALSPMKVYHTTSDHEPRRGAMYVWTKLVGNHRNT